MDFSISHRVTGIIKSKNTRENVSLHFRDSWSIEPEFQQKTLCGKNLTLVMCLIEASKERKKKVGDACGQY